MEEMLETSLQVSDTSLIWNHVEVQAFRAFLKEGVQMDPLYQEYIFDMQALLDSTCGVHENMALMLLGDQGTLTPALKWFPWWFDGMLIK